MNDTFEQTLTLRIACSDIVHGLKTVANLPQAIISTDDEARRAINHIVNCLGFRRSYINDHLDLDIQCQSAKLDADSVLFTLSAKSTRDVEPREYWKECAERFNKAVHALHEALGSSAA